MSAQDFPKLPQDQQWEYATLMLGQTAGFFGTIGAKQTVQWSSTLEGEGQSNFEQSAPDLLYLVGRAGWELVSSTTATNIRGGTTHESAMIFVFKQRRATTEDYALAQLIDPAALLKRATKYMGQQNPSMALKALNKALSFSPQQRELYHVARGRVYLSLNDEERALDEVGQALRANEQCAEAYMERANILCRRNDYDNAISDYNQALRCIREDYALITEIKYMRGSAYRQVGRAKEAIRDFKDCLNWTQLDADMRNKIEGWIKELERRR